MPGIPKQYGLLSACITTDGKDLLMLLTYHEVTAAPSKYVYSATVPELREHVQRIRYFSQAADAGGITFDDGHISQFIHAAPVLEQERCQATFFITAGWSGVRADYMTWPQLRELASLGHEIQAHGLTHTLLTHCTPEQLTEELRGSKRRIEDGLGLPVYAISMPGGRWNTRVVEACAQEGYRTVYTSHPYAGIRQFGGATVIGRAMVRRATSSEALVALLRSEKNIWSKERIRFYVKHSFRSALGDRLYHQLWSWAGRADQKLITQENVRGNSA